MPGKLYEIADIFRSIITGKMVMFILDDYKIYIHKHDNSAQKYTIRDLPVV